MRFRDYFSKTTFFCFSPPVMLFTLILEFFLAGYIIISSRWHRVSTVIITLLLVCLGIFQLAEFQVCSGKNSVFWMQLGYITITFLPALGIHLVTVITKHKWIRNLGYIFTLGFIGVFLFGTHYIQSATCGGNYVLVNTNGTIGQIYYLVYYTIALAVIGLEILWVVGKYTNQDKEIRETRLALYWLFTGLVIFLIPTGAVYLLSPAARSGIPSIMCGFAVFLAVILAIFVYPLYRKLDL